mgnify:CR=1 FL=1
MDVTHWDELDYGTQAIVQVINNAVSSGLSSVSSSVSGLGFWLFVIAVTLIVIAVKMPKKADSKKLSDRISDASARRIAKQLSTMRGKGGAFTIAGPWCHAGVSSVTGSSEVIGIVEDMDDEWVLLRTKGKGGKDGGTQRLVRISEVTKIEELVEK